MLEMRVVVRKVEKNREDYIYESLIRYFDIIKKAHLVLPINSIYEVYHHLGYENYDKEGALFVKAVNKEYCKSYAILLPGQKYPAHYHKIKKETFFALYGDIEIVKEGERFKLNPGEMLNVERLEEHSFSTQNGAAFEELSTAYLRNDSIYLNRDIMGKYYGLRKTVVKNDEWERMKSERGCKC